MKKLFVLLLVSTGLGYGILAAASEGWFGDEMPALSIATAHGARGLTDGEIPARDPGVSTALRRAEDMYLAISRIEDPKQRQLQKIAAREVVALALGQNGLVASEFDALARQMAVLNDELVFSRVVSPESMMISVQSGDSLGLLARRHDTTVGFLRRINGLQGDVIWPGQRLKVVPGKPGILIDKSDYCLRFYVGALLVRAYRVGIGANDSTPEESFVIANKIENPNWKGLPPEDPRNILGTRWLGFAPQGAYKGYGIHGTKEPESIGQAKSSGCVRMHNADVEDLYDLVPEGTLVRIQP